MQDARSHRGLFALALLLGLGAAGCSSQKKSTEEAAPAPREVETGAADTAVTQDTTRETPAVALPTDTAPSAPKPDTAAATPPITPPSPPEQANTPPAGAAKPSQPANQGATGQGLKVSAVEYEGWRQYNANCARCHGQDALPNPVAANLLISLAPGGPMDSPEKFREVVTEGRPARGMPGFKSQLTPDKIDAIYAYLKGRAGKRIPPGRPERPQA